MPVVIGGDNLPSAVRIGLTDLTYIGGASGPPGPPGSGITESDNDFSVVSFLFSKNILNFVLKMVKVLGRKEQLCFDEQFVGY